MLQPITDPDIIEGYLTDASNVRGTADALVRPGSAAEVVEIVRHCQAQGIPLTITAGRTSTTAAPVPNGGWLLSTERLNRVVQISTDVATAEAGVFLGALQTQIEEQGRFFPPDPTSRHECTLGASIACNASGARSFRYGSIRPWILSVEVVLPDGSMVHADRDTPIPSDWPVAEWCEPNVKTAAGFYPALNLLDLFIGQEGTLGIITRATVRLTDLPGHVIGLLGWFANREAAVDFVVAARSLARRDASGPVSPRCLEYLDKHCLTIARQTGADVPDGAGAALFCEQEVVPSIGDEAHLAAWWDLLVRHGGELADHTIVTETDEARERLHRLRHAVPAGINERAVRNGMPKVGTDLAVPDDALDRMMDRYEACPLESITFGHIGDNHLHCNVLPRTAEELVLAREWYAELAREAVRLGGTVSAEHGIGKLKRASLEYMVGPEVLEGFRRLKAHLDPNWILGRGTMITRS
ncbi:MAG: D-lactate dehydrogenase (cytochrome) [Kiritimatiellia bacterium]